MEQYRGSIVGINVHQQLVNHFRQRIFIGLNLAKQDLAGNRHCQLDRQLMQDSDRFATSGMQLQQLLNQLLQRFTQVFYRCRARRCGWRGRRNRRPWGFAIRNLITGQPHLARRLVELHAMDGP